MENDYILLKRIRDILFFIFITCLMLFLSLFVYIDCYALSVNDAPSSIRANLIDGSYENFNVVYDYPLYTPKDSGNVNVYFNHDASLFSPTGLPINHFYETNNLYFYFNSGLSSDSEIYFSLWFQSNKINEFDYSISVVNNDYFLLNDLLSYNSQYPVDIYKNGVVSHIRPIFIDYNYYGYGWFRFNYKVQVHSFDNIYFFLSPWGSNRYYAYRVGFTLNNIINWNGVVDTETLNNSINNQTVEIINNNNTNTQILKTEIGGLPGKIINGLAGFFQSIINAIGNIASSIWSLFSGAFTTLFGWLSDIFDGIQDILSDDSPTSEWLSNYINNFPGINDNLIAQIITLPIHILTKLLGVNTCSPVILGNLYGTTLILPCLGTTISNILGSLINIVGWMVAFYIYYLTFVKIKDLLFEMLTLEGNVARKMKIKF